MDIAQISHNISLAKQDNAMWLGYTEALISGHSVTKAAIPTKRETCTPCQWLYDHSDEVDAMYMRVDPSEIEFFHFDIMDQIEILRYDLKEKYSVVFKTYLPEMNTFFFSSFLHNLNPPTQYDYLDAKLLYEEMQDVVKELDDKLDLLERSIYRLCQLQSA